MFVYNDFVPKSQQHPHAHHIRTGKSRLQDGLRIVEGEETAVYPLHSETAPGIESHLSESGIARTDFEFAETGRTGGLRCMAQHRTAYPLPL